MYDLDARDAVELAHALVAERIATWGGRVVAIKGPVADKFGLRVPHASSDADVLVAREDFDAAVSDLGLCGWVLRPISPTAAIVADHSVSLMHPAWPIDIDVHRRFPGLEGRADGVFNRVWDRRSSIILAGRQCWAVDFESAVLIEFLHAVRAGAESERHVYERDYLLRNVVSKMDEDAARALAERARELGAEGTARELLEELGVEPVSSRSIGMRARNLRWASELRFGKSPSSRALLSVTRVAPKTLASSLGGVLWPREADYQRDHGEAHLSRTRLNALRLRRLSIVLWRVPLEVFKARSRPPRD